jgi:hypothetical protein
LAPQERSLSISSAVPRNGVEPPGIYTSALSGENLRSCVADVRDRRAPDGDEP